MAESIRSRHTGHVGSSYIDACEEPRRESAWKTESSASILTDNTWTTLHISGSIELKGLPLYASANSAASAELKNLIMTMERFGKESRIIRRCAMLSAAGARNPRKSDGVIHDGTARTPNIGPSESSCTLEDVEAVDLSSSGEGLVAESLNT